MTQVRRLPQHKVTFLSEAVGINGPVSACAPLTLLHLGLSTGVCTSLAKRIQTAEQRAPIPS